MTLLFGKDRKPDYPETVKRKRPPLPVRRAVLERQGDRCACISDRCIHTPVMFEWDHIVPLWKSGTNKADNWQALCGPCHRHKTSAEAEERATMHRKRGDTGQRARRAKHGPSLKGRPFDRTKTKKMRTGKVVPRA